MKISSIGNYLETCQEDACLRVSEDLSASFKHVRDLVADSGTNWVLVVLTDGDVMSLLSAGADDAIVVESQKDLQSVQCAVANLQKVAQKTSDIQNLGKIVGRSPKMSVALKQAALSLQSKELPILILGETGCGKGLLAKAICAADTTRASESCYTLDCGSITDSLFGSELFGHVRGAFTGALSNRRGAFECAAGGYIFLDEVGELSGPTQTFLLNTIQERCFKPVGSEKPIDMDCRIVAATNHNLQNDVDSGSFRKDLFYRLNGYTIVVPPLRERPDDILELFSHFLDQESCGAELTPEVCDLLTAYDYPGNVRELESIAKLTAARLGDETRLRLGHLPLDRLTPQQPTPTNSHDIETMVESGMCMRDIESEVSLRATSAAINYCKQKRPDYSRTELVEQAAKALGVSPRTVYNKLNSLEKLN